MSLAATGLLRSLIARGDIEKDKILLTSFESSDWHSLTFSGERHEISLRLIGADATAAAQRLLANIADAEWRIPGSIVADIGLDERADGEDGSVALRLEALTILE
jgi:hypothetical protein